MTRKTSTGPKASSTWNGWDYGRASAHMKRVFARLNAMEGQITWRNIFDRDGGGELPEYLRRQYGLGADGRPTNRRDADAVSEQGN